MSKVGFDLDGVLVNFDKAYTNLAIKLTGRNLFPEAFAPPTWFYLEHYGYTSDEVSLVWNTITKDRFFWSLLEHYPDTQEAIDLLIGKSLVGDDIYFITSRPGIEAKVQTEAWLKRFIRTDGFTPTVLISGAKGLCCRVLDLDYYIDDRWENCLDVRAWYNKTKVYMLKTSQNASQVEKVMVEGVIVVESVLDMLKDIK